MIWGLDMFVSYNVLAATGLPWTCPVWAAATCVHVVFLMTAKWQFDPHFCKLVLNQVCS